MRDAFAQAAIALIVGLAGSGIGIKVAVAELTVRVNEISATLDRTEMQGAMLYENKLAINSADARTAQLERSISHVQGQLNECMRRDVAQGSHEAIMSRVTALEHDRHWFSRVLRKQAQGELPLN